MITMSGDAKYNLSAYNLLGKLMTLMKLANITYFYSSNGRKELEGGGE